jgi:hypothetical protein
MICGKVSWGGRLLMVIVLAATLTGCGSFTNKDIGWGPRIGFRPDEPTFKVLTAKEKAKPTESKIETAPCDLLNEYLVYGLNLKEAYRTRATQNRSWIYVAAITGLGVAAASGALAAASAAAAGTLALLAISGGFTAAAFATIDNSELADVYTVAANDINTALACTELRLTAALADCKDKLDCQDQSCSAQLGYLTFATANARNNLETARTRSAAGALARASAQRTLLDQEITKAQQAKEAADKAEAARKAKAEAVVATEEANAAKKKAEQAPQDANAKAEADKLENRAQKQTAEAKAKEKDAEETKTKLSCPVLPDFK